MRLPFRRALSVLFALVFIPAAAFSAGEVEESAEKLRVQDFYEGTVLDLTQYEGKAVFINYFTEWCGYCMAEMPDIKRAYDAYDPDSLQIILIHP